MKSLFCLVCFAVFSTSLLAAPPASQSDAPLPIDPDLRIGRLENGLTYYIRENRKPEGRALLRLVVNVGSLQEEEEERGIAHFVEHMAFNGTRRFEKHEIINFLEGIGMRFGSHLNASTSFNETIYKLEIPLDDPETVEKAFLILEDWASGILFEEDEIEKERGVVVEEWRARKGVGQRLQEKQLPLLYHGSKYVDRLPIGLVPVINSLSRKQFVDFYQKWYRPNLMAVVAVGDFSADEIEAKIKARFGHLKNPDHAPDRGEFPLASHEETFFSIETDPELSRSTAGILFKTDKMEFGTARIYRKNLVERIYFSMMNSRLSERTKQDDPPFIGAGLGRGSLGREKGVYRMGLAFIGADYEGGLQAVAQEMERARRDGFEQSELDRVKLNILRSLEKLYAERDKRQSASFLREYISHFLVGESVPGLEKELELTRAVLADLSLEEVNAVDEFVTQSSDRVVIFTAPEKEGYEKPTPEQLLAALALSPEEGLEAYDDGVSDAPLLSIESVPGTIVDEVYHESIDAYEWTLSNGARVVAKSTDFKNDEILVTAFSPGGSSLFSDEDFVSGAFAAQVLAESGLGQFDSIELRKKLAGKIVSSSSRIVDDYETLGGSASPRDLETFFQLLHMQFLEPRLDLQAFAAARTRLIASVEDRLKAPNAVFSDAVTETLYRGHPRHRPMSVEIVEEIDPERAFELYKERFADASDFTFVFVGSMDRDILKSHLERYVASLPNLGRIEQGQFNGDERTPGRHKVRIEKNIEDKSTVQAMFYGAADWSPENAYALGFAKDILNIRLREKLREDESKVYGARVSGGLSRFPRETFFTSFSFTCDPENADELVELARAEIKQLQKEGPLLEDLEKVRQQRIRSHERGLKENGYWLSSFSRYLQQDRPLDTILANPERARAFEAKDAQRAAQLYFNDTNMLIAKLDPLPKIAVE